MSRIVVTGGSGFIGTNLVALLQREGHEVSNIDIKPPPDAAQLPLWQRVDILDAPALASVLRDAAPHAIVHLAARTDLNGRDVDDYAANTEGVRNLIDAAAGASVARVLFASSRLVCRIGYQPSSPVDYLPTTPYGQSKVVGEQLVRAAHDVPFDWVLLRPTSIWGPWFHVPYRNFFDAVRSGHYVHPRGLRIRKSFGYVGNTVFQLSRLLSVPGAAIHGQMVYLADYDPLEVHDWGSRVARAFGARPVPQVPLPAMRVLAAAGDGLLKLGWKNAPLTSFRLDNLVTEMLHDTTPLRKLCGELPFDMDTGIAHTVHWMQTHASRAAA